MGSAPPVDAPQAPPSPAVGLAGGEHHGVQTQIDVEEIDRLVDLTYGALLRRKPDWETVLAYREGFANGTTFHDLIDDVTGSDEYRESRVRIAQRRPNTRQAAEASLGHRASDDLSGTMALLGRRLVEKGYRLPLVAEAEGDRGSCDNDGRRMRSLLVTLSHLDRL